MIDWETPGIAEQTQAITRDLTYDTAKAQALFEWVRDAIPHTWDIQTDIVTCTASEVLAQHTGALLRQESSVGRYAPLYRHSRRLLLSSVSARAPL